MLSKVASRKGKGDLRLDRISDGSNATGFAWTYTSGNMEGLRGTTFIELNKSGEIGRWNFLVCYRQERSAYTFTNYLPPFFFSLFHFD